MNDAEEIKKRLNIVEVISGYVRLLPAGANKKALCPFHNEKSPSFTVNEEKQIFHCFGCGKGGDVFTFVQEMEGLGFREALKMLAERAGVELSGGDFKPRAGKKEAREVLKEALVFFEKTLTSPLGEEARAYLSFRKVSEKLIKEFRLGFAPAGWSGLTDYLASRGISAKEAEKSGLVLESPNRPGSFYDRFRARIMFPIFDGFDNPIGFSGRVLPGDDSKGGKYINTPQTDVYDKSQALYGLNLAKQKIKKKDFSLILEGNLDVVLSYKAGVKNAVASCGTAVTREQLKILRRYSNNVFFAFDNDEAGLKAAEKGLDLALEEGM
jgi:DNA primase